MKRFLAFTLVMACILTCAVIPASAMSFSDLFADHWAYGDVQALVSDGTVKGYEDGTFRPNGTVTRAEFVKMLGNGPTRYDGSYSDVTSSHWAYEYIMSSGMPKDNTNTFRPDEPITRGVVVELLWNRYRSEVNSFVPSLITYQYLPNPEAVAWAYTTSLIQGDDGVNLRLDDSLSRAEAAAVIMRARKTDRKIVTFDEMLKPAILENVFNGLALFDDMTYDPQRTITNGEMARAALRLGTEKTDLVYSMVIPPVDFEHPYAKDLAVICTSSLSKDRLTKAYADKAANFGDAVAALTYQFIAKSTDSNYGAMTEGLPASVSPIMNVCLTYAKNNGFISLKEDLDAPITLGEFTKLCMIVDSKLGSQTDIATEIHSLSSNFTEINHSLLLTEQPYGDFRVMLKNMPSAVYSTPYRNTVGTPKDCYNFTREYYSIFIGMLQHIKESIYNKTGVEVNFTYYPSLVCEAKVGYTMRVACDISLMEGTKTIAELYNVREDLEYKDTVLKEGDRFFLDIATGESIKSVSATAEFSYIDQLLLIN